MIKIIYFHPEETRRDFRGIVFAWIPSLNLACKTEHPLPVSGRLRYGNFIWGLEFFFDFKFCKTVWVPAVYNMMIVVVVAELKKTLIINLHQHNLV